MAGSRRFSYFIISDIFRSNTGKQVLIIFLLYKLQIDDTDYLKKELKVRPFLYGISGSLVGYVIYIFFSSISSIYFYASIGLLLGLIDGIVD
ncbi:MAG: hypothetical protein JXR90_17085, partial [Spirochaetes bacterium]|nr:hypothetical protein [Spirochaetota bacterium]